MYVVGMGLASKGGICKYLMFNHLRVGCQVWHEAWWRPCNTISKTMTSKQQYQRIKQQATRAMLSGDLVHYLRRLRELHQFRLTLGGPIP